MRPAIPLWLAMLVATLAGLGLARPALAATEAAAVAVGVAEAVESGAETGSEPAANELFPHGELFEPLIADLRWPRFTAAYQWRFGTDEFNGAGSVGFGESFAFLRSPEHDWGRWEVGMQAAMFGLFDMTAVSFDMVNADFYVGLTAAIEHKGVTTQARVYHLSSHLGDEYLIENGGPRDSISLEVLDVLASFEPIPSLRVYGGGGVVLSTATPFDRLGLQAGLEWTSPVAFLNERLRPIAGIDVQSRQQFDWEPGVAVLLGLRLAKPDDPVRNVEFFLRYYHGTSPEFQFLEQTLDLLGLGVRLGF